MIETPSAPVGAAELPVRFVVYFPEEAKDSRVDARELEAAAVRIFSERFGGVTAYSAMGTFTLASGVSKTEAVTVLETYCDRKAWIRNREGVVRLVGLVGSLLNQEALGYSVDGKMILIEAANDSLPEMPLLNLDVYSFLLRALD